MASTDNISESDKINPLTEAEPPPPEEHSLEWLIWQISQNYSQKIANDMGKSADELAVGQDHLQFLNEFRRLAGRMRPNDDDVRMTPELQEFIDKTRAEGAPLLKEKAAIESERAELESKKGTMSTEDYEKAKSALDSRENTNTNNLKAYDKKMESLDELDIFDLKNMNAFDLNNKWAATYSANNLVLEFKRRDELSNDLQDCFNENGEVDIKKLKEILDKSENSLLRERLEAAGYKSDGASSDTLATALKDEIQDLDTTELKKLYRSVMGSGQNRISEDELKKLIDLANQPGNEKFKALIAGGRKFTREQKQNLMDDIKSKIDNVVSPENDILFQKTTRFQTELDQMYQYLMQTVRTLHEAKKKMAINVKGG